MDTNKKDEDLNCGEYLSQVIRMNQLHLCENKWTSILSYLTIKNDIVVFSHMKNKYNFIDISVCDFVWIICLCTFFFSTIITGLCVYTIDNKYKQTVARYYHDADYMGATEHPDYVKQIYDIIPIKQYNEILNYKLKMKFPQTTNYCYVVREANGITRLREVSDEDYYQAVREYKLKRK